LKAALTALLIYKRTALLSIAIGGILAGGLFLVILPAVHAENVDMPGAPASEIHITADRLVSKQADRLAEFSGNVRARQNDTTITSDVLRIYFKTEAGVPPGENGNGDADSIEKLVAAGNVVIEYENSTAFCDEAVYTASDGLLVLRGEKVLVRQDGSSITGDKIVLNRDTGEISVTGSTESQVEAVFEQSGGAGILSE